MRPILFLSVLLCLPSLSEAKCFYNTKCRYGDRFGRVSGGDFWIPKNRTVTAIGNACGFGVSKSCEVLIGAREDNSRASEYEAGKCHVGQGDILFCICDSGHNCHLDMKKNLEKAAEHGYDCTHLIASAPDYGSEEFCFQEWQWYVLVIGAGVGSLLGLVICLFAVTCIARRKKSAPIEDVASPESYSEK